MRDLARVVAGTIARHGLAGADDRVAVAVSGGPDSVALMWLLRELAPDLQFSLVGVIHINHQLRGAESDADEAFVRALAARLGLACEVARIDVMTRARTAHRSIETAAREARYAAFEDLAATLGATRVATGHTEDDQAETVLLRLLRGAGARGVGGIRVRRGRYIRPVLDCRRDELRRHLRALGETFREDASNLDRAVPRNRIRRDLLPVIEDFAPGGVPALARFAQLSAEDEEYLDGEAIKWAASSVLSDGAGVQVKTGGLVGLPPALARRVVRRVVELAAPDARLDSRHLEAIRVLAAADKVDGHLDVPGVSVDRRGDALIVAAGRPPAAVAGQFEVPLPVPGEAAMPALGATLVARRASNGWAPSLDQPPDVAVVQAASVTLPLAVRNRRPGDRFRPLGAPGRRKVQDVFVDHKVPRSERDRVPIVIDAVGRIVWVAGVGIADECRVTAPHLGVVILELRRQ